MLVDGRHGLKANDKEFIANLDHKKIKFQVILTKCDLVLRNLIPKIYKMTEQVRLQVLMVGFANI